MLKNFDPDAPIGALIKTSLVDYPERVSTALFLDGCNLCCPYCYNKDLVTGNGDYDAVSFNDVIQHLKKRRNVLSGFVISGGEPCISPYLEKLILSAHELGYAVKLDTNGTRPDTLQSLFSEKELTPDFIAMDIKTSPARYSLVGRSCEAELCQSIKIMSSLPASKREFRTVLVPGLIDRSDIETITAILPKDVAWRFAHFRNGNCLNTEYNTLEPYPPAKEQELVSFARTLIPDSVLR